ncbi:uncharacterized protein PV09_06620 [Verruconis gallopava]|uniref:Mitotic checkpoint regulator, MAD2B-interacting-domain-containing protein n=1 Tax=Verruconis gallopava TaxID=253628 RepID=A0A0D1YN07_9PEZI|nr:uncharacterized protein PV09_06620 [Verruconis gallopava]KIW02132.1 hypothetical protein PV09_06620 [Verruconis gallopava]
MVLVGYSDSESSDNEAPPAPQPAARPATKSTPMFVDPGTKKIKVNLSSLSTEADKDEEAGSDDRPTKRKRTGGGLNINAFLPPPKQPAKPLNNESTFAAKRAAGRGLGSGVNLKTGAEPAFTRTEMSSTSLDLDGEPKDIKEVIAELRRSRQPANTSEEVASVVGLPQIGEKEVKLVGNPMRFKPKSVARGPIKKKAAVPRATTAASANSTTDPIGTTFASSSITNSTSQTAPPAKSKVSLFSIGKEENEPAVSNEPALEDDAEVPAAPEEAYSGGEQLYSRQTYDTSTGAKSAAASAVDGLNLSASEMRQLFGRKAGKNGGFPDLSSVKVINYNADEQYAENEELRARGELVQHNPVRGIAPGKHSLKQLVNAAATQADALEEHFAMGKRNQREAGARYGW